MNKKIVCMLVSLCMCMCVGCGKKTANDTPASQTTPASVEAPAQTEVTTDTNSNVNNSQNEARQETVEEKKPDAVQISEGIASAEGKVLNNGGEFIQVGDLVYFRQYGPDAKETNSLSENFADVVNSSNTLITYNTKTGEVDDFFYDSNFGGICFYNDRFFFCKYTDADYGTMTYSTAANGSDKLDITDGRLVDIYEKKGVLIIDRITNDGQNYFEGWSAERDSECLFICGGGANTYYNYQGIVGSYMFLDSNGVLYCVDLSNDNYKMISLGSLPKVDNYPTSIKSVKAYRDNYYVCSYAVEGSGGFVSKEYICSLDPKKENSIKVVKECTADELDDRVQDIYFDSNNEPVFGMKNNNGIYVENNTLYYDNNGTSSAVYSEVWKDVNGDSSEIEALADVELVGDRIFAHVIKMYHDEANDIGWRYSYRMTEMLYVTIDLNGNVNVINDIIYDY